MPINKIKPATNSSLPENFFEPFGLTMLEKQTLVTLGSQIEPALRSVGLTPQFAEALPIPGIYAIISGAGGGKSELCRKLDVYFQENLSKMRESVDYLFTLAGEPEDPHHSFEAVFNEITLYLFERCSKQEGNPAIVIIDSFSDLAYQEAPRAPRPDTETIKSELLSGTGAISITGVPGATLIDLILRKSGQYLTPNSAALAGGLTGSYYQMLKKLSMAATAAGVYLFVVLNPLSFDDRGLFRDAISGVVAAAISIDRQSAGLARCILPNSEGEYDGKNRTRRPITNDRMAVTSNDISDMMSSLLGGHNG